MIRYDPKMLGSDIRNPYGSIQYPPREQAWWLIDTGHPLLAKWLLEGLITVKKSAQIVDDLELGKMLREGRNGR